MGEHRGIEWKPWMMLLSSWVTGCSTQAVLTSSGGSLSLEGGLYTGTSNCETTIELGTENPFGSFDVLPLSVIVTEEGYPSDSGYVLRPGATYPTQLEQATVTLEVTSFETLDDGVVVVLEGEVVLCADQCLLLANDGFCNENGACGGEGFCEQDGEIVLELCSPGTDCSDCASILAPVNVTIRQEHRYTSTGPSALRVQIRKHVDVSRPEGRVTVTCDGNAVLVPDSND